MVTLQTCNTKSADTECRETVTVQDQGAKSGNANMYKTFRTATTESHPAPQDNPDKELHKTRSVPSFMTGIAHPLLLLYDLVAGPPMTQRDRHLRAMGEANVRNVAGLNWFSRTTW